MCISTTPRNRAVLARPAVDVAQLLSHVDTNMVIKPTDLTIADNIVSDLGSNKKRNRHITVVHNYHDHSNAHAADYQVEHPARGGVTTPFPLKLHYMLLSTAQEGMEHVVSWQPHGRCFLVHKPKEFIEMLPRYFKLSKLASFQRQLNLYGFQRLTRGRDRGGYYHELFLRDREFIAHSITRIKVKGTGVRARSNPEQEPDFWGVLPWVAPDDAPKAKQLDEDDVVVAFGNKTFHFLEPFQAMETPLGLTKPQVHSASPAMVGSEFDALLNGDAAAFFQDFDFPETLGADIEDDDVFGNLLEQLIS
jgi:HSF-type DNA-binding